MTFKIPVMDDPLGKYWDQPKDIRRAPMDATHVILRPGQVRELSEYSAPWPTGVYPGKCWRCIESKPDRHLLVWYGPETDTGMCEIMFRELLSVGG